MVDIENIEILDELDVQGLLDVAEHLGVVSNEVPRDDREALIAIIKRQQLVT